MITHAFVYALMLKVGVRQRGMGSCAGIQRRPESPLNRVRISLSDSILGLVKHDIRADRLEERKGV